MFAPLLYSMFMSVEQNLETRFSESGTAERLKSLTRGAVADGEFENKWQVFIKEFRNWEASPIANQISRLNVRLEFLRRLSAVFPEARLNQNPSVAELVLTDSGVKNVGDTLTGKQPGGVTQTLKVVRREISDAIGILYTLETEGGSRFTREFFD